MLSLVSKCNVSPENCCKGGEGGAWVGMKGVEGKRKGREEEGRGKAGDGGKEEGERDGENGHGDDKGWDEVKRDGEMGSGEGRDQKKREGRRRRRKGRETGDGKGWYEG